MTLLEGAAVQRPSLEGTHVAHVIVDGATRLIQSFDDPLVVRGARDPDSGQHSYKRLRSETVYVDVPLEAGAMPDEIAIRLVNVSKVARRPTDPAGVEELLQAQPRGARTLATITTAQLMEHPDWAQLALPGETAIPPGGHFEIYVDRAGRYRWRLRRPDGEIVAESSQGYADRATCEADLRWVRERATQAPIRSLDVP